MQHHIHAVNWNSRVRPLPHRPNPIPPAPWYAPRAGLAADVRRVLADTKGAKA